MLNMIKQQMEGSSSYFIIYLKKFFEPKFFRRTAFSQIRYKAIRFPDRFLLQSRFHFLRRVKR